MRVIGSCRRVAWGSPCLSNNFRLFCGPYLAPGARSTRRWRSRLLGPSAADRAGVVLSLAPLFVLSPDAIWHNVIEYRSLGNTFGVAWATDPGRIRQPLPLYSPCFTITVLAATVAAAMALWRRDWRHDGDPVLFSAMLLLALFTLGPGYGSQYWFWVVPLLLVCYADFGTEVGRVILISAAVVVATNIFEYAVELNLGRFLLSFLSSPRLQSLSDYFVYPSPHLIWLRMPMTLPHFASCWSDLHLGKDDIILFKQ